MPHPLRPQNWASKGQSRYVVTVAAPDCVAQVDAGTFGNDARYANDARGTAVEQNAAYCRRWFPELGQWNIAIASLHAIATGQEILVSYGDQYWEVCACVQAFA